MLYHASRELLFNVIKHAEVTTARLTAQVRDSSVCIEIADDGVGFDGDAALDHDTEGENREGFGMYSIRERLRLFGGSLDVASKTGEGTVVTVTMPIEASESQSGERAR
ncbi:MAG: ATP-binding protein [Trueperaceae bacterium]|nr:ATP-binding protein [Trueperaceae bacterium]